MAIVMRVFPFDGGTTTMWFFLEPLYPGVAVMWATAIAMAVWILFGSRPTNLMLQRTYWT